MDFLALVGEGKVLTWTYESSAAGLNVVQELKICSREVSERVVSRPGKAAGRRLPDSSTLLISRPLMMMGSKQYQPADNETNQTPQHTGPALT